MIAAAPAPWQGAAYHAPQGEQTCLLLGLSKARVQVNIRAAYLFAGHVCFGKGEYGAVYFTI